MTDPSWVVSGEAAANLRGFAEVPRGALRECRERVLALDDGKQG